MKKCFVCSESNFARAQQPRTDVSSDYHIYKQTRPGVLEKTVLELKVDLRAIETLDRLQGSN